MAGIEVALCGELAAVPLATPLLLGLGLEGLSCAQQALHMTTSSAVRGLLADAHRQVD